MCEFRPVVCENVFWQWEQIRKLRNWKMWVPMCEFSRVVCEKCVLAVGTKIEKKLKIEVKLCVCE